MQKTLCPVHFLGYVFFTKAKNWNLKRRRRSLIAAAPQGLSFSTNIDIFGQNGFKFGPVIAQNGSVTPRKIVHVILIYTYISTKYTAIIATYAEYNLVANPVETFSQNTYFSPVSCLMLACISCRNKNVDLGMRERKRLPRSFFENIWLVVPIKTIQNGFQDTSCYLDQLGILLSYSYLVRILERKNSPT